MRGKLCIIAIALFTFGGCSSKETTSNVNTTNASPAATQPVKSKIDACSLLTSDDLKSVQGEAYTSAQRSDRQDGDFIVAQCYFALPTTANSVVLNVTTAREGVSTTPRKFWEGTFAHNFAHNAEKLDREKEEKEKEKSRDKAREKGREEREGEGGEESPKPEKITGLGEDAYWLASSVGGALYVLKGEEFFRISVGGAGDAKSKLAKSKTLAEKVLKKLS